MPAAALPEVVVTRPQPQADEWVAALGGRGLLASALPLLVIGPPTDPEPVHAAWRRIADAALVMFVSPNAVHRFFAAAPAGWRWPGAALAGSTGAGTAAALQRAGVAPGCVVTPLESTARFDSEALWDLLRDRRGPNGWAGARALIVRGEGGRDWLAGVLRAAGAEVDLVAAYRREAPVVDAAFRSGLGRALARPSAHRWLFSSSEAVANLARLAPGADWSASSALASHPRIAATARGIGFGRVDEVPPSADAVAAALRSGAC